MNTETKHTPGPWHIASVVLPKLDSHTALAVWDEAHQVLPDSINGRPICILTPIDKRNPIDEANAALIASAPDMAKEIAQLKAEKAELVDALLAVTQRHEELESEYASLAAANESEAKDKFARRHFYRGHVSTAEEKLEQANEQARNLIAKHSKV